MGDDELYFNADDTVSGGEGYDTAILTSGSISLNMAAAGIEEAHGLDGNDSFDGSGSADSVKLYGYGGNDVLKGGAGYDILDGGDGDDVIYFDSSDDVHGGAGVDTAYLTSEGYSSVDMELQGIEIIHGNTGFRTSFNGSANPWRLAA